MNTHVTFHDKKCVLPWCTSIIDWSSWNIQHGVCDVCYKRCVGKQYCKKCKKLCQTTDITEISMMIQHIPDWRCVICKSKPIDVLDIVKYL